ncbi:MAG: hypothetical protein K0Q79_3756 [Flavipsychrobacter sp.]|jgi:hypothetical protein|nr:hypothetical protein [Flavipsychrobacter sp.]
MNIFMHANYIIYHALVLVFPPMLVLFSDQHARGGQVSTRFGMFHKASGSCKSLNPSVSGGSPIA